MRASGGDLFLDEIGNLPLDVQIGLLRVLEQREVAPLGAQQGEKVDIRFLSATNEDIELRAQSGIFRADLLDRLREAGAIYMPPLPDRLDDIPLLVEKLVREAESAKPGALRRAVEQQTLTSLRRYSWPGNIRELRNAIYGAVTRYPDVEHLFPMHIRLSEEDSVASPITAEPPAASSGSRNHAASAGPGDILRALEAFSESGLDGPSVVGILPQAQRAMAHFQVRLLRAALLATRRPTPDRPNGDILIHPAVKLLMGNRAISASKAADIIKKIINASPDSRELILADPVLNEAFQISNRLRPGTRARTE